MSKQREMIYLDELLLKIKENREIGEIMGNTMIEIAKSCKTVQKEEMPHYKQIRREEVMTKLAEGKDVYCAIFYDTEWSRGMYRLQSRKVESMLSMIKETEDAVFYERIEESGETE